MFDFRKYASRKYVDLIHRASSKWANWDPPITVKVGSFGRIDKKTGELVVEGNIYEERFQGILESLYPGTDPNRYKPVEAEIENDIKICSEDVKRVEVSVDGSLNTVGLGSALIQEEWQFPESKSAALLIVHSPQQKYIPQNALLAQLGRIIPELENKCLVASVISCPAYFLHLSSKGGGKVKVALGFSAPIPHAPVVSAGGGFGLKWHTNMETSFSRSSAHPEGLSVYTPLYTLKKFPKWNLFARSPAFMGSFFVSPVLESPVSPALLSPGSDVDAEISWDNAHKPWFELDDDGEELFLDEDLAAEDDYSAQPHQIHTIELAHKTPFIRQG